MGTLCIRGLRSKAGRDIGYQVYDYEAQVVLAQFKNRDFGGAAFWRRAQAAAEACKRQIEKSGAS